MNEFTELEKLQAQTGQIIKGKMIENLRANDSVASGNLLRSIKVDNTTNKQNKLETVLEIKAWYAELVDKGIDNKKISTNAYLLLEDNPCLFVFKDND